jgi:hypothetical protein
MSYVLHGICQLSHQWDHHSLATSYIDTWKTSWLQREKRSTGIDPTA